MAISTRSTPKTCKLERLLPVNTLSIIFSKIIGLTKANNWIKQDKIKIKYGYFKNPMDKSIEVKAATDDEISKFLI
mgnify:CR=1 FL=1